MSKKTKKWKARYEDTFECCLRAETDLGHEQRERRLAQAELAEALAEITKLNDEQDAMFERGVMLSANRIKLLERNVEDLDLLLFEAERQRDEALAALAAERGDTVEMPVVAAMDTFAGETLTPLTVAWHGLPDPRPQIAQAQWTREQAAVDAALRENDPRGPHHLDCMRDWTHTGPCHEPEAKSAIEVPKVGKDEGEGMLISYTEAINVRPGDRIRALAFGKRFVTVLRADLRGADRVDLTVRVPRNDADPSTPYGDHSLTLEHNAVVERNENP